MRKAIYIGLILSIAAGCMFTGCGDMKPGKGKDSERYYGCSRFEFEFVNGEFDTFSMDYLP